MYVEECSQLRFQLSLKYVVEQCAQLPFQLSLEECLQLPFQLSLKYVEQCLRLQFQLTLTLSAHVREGYSTHFVCQSVSHSTEELEDGNPSTFKSDINLKYWII